MQAFNIFLDCQDHWRIGPSGHLLGLDATAVWGLIDHSGITGKDRIALWHDVHALVRGVKSEAG